MKADANKGINKERIAYTKLIISPPTRNQNVNHEPIMIKAKYIKVLSLSFKCYFQIKRYFHTFFYIITSLIKGVTASGEARR